MHKLSMFLLGSIISAGCVDYRFGRKDDANDDDDTEDTGFVEPLDTGEVLEEICNGVDDNGNGEIDEGFPDYDADGIADCTDEDCDVDVPEAQLISFTKDCGSADISDDPWDMVVEWHWTGLSTKPEYHSVYHTPLVANMTDDDGDGDVDEWDTPDVVFVASMDGFGAMMGGYLVVLDGATGAELWSKFGFIGGIQPLIVDVEGDGWPEILLRNSTNFMTTLVDYQGKEVWSADLGNYIYPLAADLEDDGDVELLVGSNLVDGTTGAVITALASEAPSFPAIGDVDQDGTKDLVFADGVWDETGKRRWRHTREGHFSFPLIVDTDGDPGGEVVVLSTRSFRVYDDDGTELVKHSTISQDPRPPCAADFDGDGEVELAWADLQFFYVYELDGTLLWKTPSLDLSGSASCSAFDFDGDTRYEIVYADEDSLWILDGRTGTPVFQDTDHASGTLAEYAVVADVDGDGSAELISPSQTATPWIGKLGGTGGIIVYGHAEDRWAPSGATWNAQDFSESNYNNGTVFGTTPPWQDYNLYQGRPPLELAETDLVVDIADVCTSACSDPGIVNVSVQVGNRGAGTVTADYPVSLYADNAGALELIESKLISTDLPGGQTLDGIVFEFAGEQYGSDGLVVEVGDELTRYRECIADNNTDTWSEPACPE